MDEAGRLPALHVRVACRRRVGGASTGGGLGDAAGVAALLFIGYSPQAGRSAGKGEA